MDTLPAEDCAAQICANLPNRIYKDNRGFHVRSAPIDAFQQHRWLRSRRRNRAALDLLPNKTPSL